MLSVLVKLLMSVMLLELVALSSVMICGSIIVVLPDVVVSFCNSLVVVVSPMSKIRVATKPLAENVSPAVAFVVVLVVILVLVALAVLDAFEVVLPTLLVPVESDGGVYCASAGARLNAVAKRPKTSTSATAIDAFFIAKSVCESILTILSII
jgi:hypothetical protein